METRNQQAENPFHILDELTQLIKNSPLYWTQANLDEVAFFKTTARLKLALPYHFKQSSCLLRAQQRHSLAGGAPVPDVFRLIDELEQLVQSGKGYFFGRKFVNAERLLNQIDKIHQALPQIPENATAMLEDAPVHGITPPDKILNEQQVSRMLRILDKLSQFVERGRRFFERALIDEEAFFYTTADFKRAIPESIKQAERISRARQRNNPEATVEYQLDLFRLTDELEQLVENGEGHLFGRVFVNAEQFLNQITKMRQALPQDLANAAKILNSEPAISEGAEGPDKILTDAKAEAAHILEAAQAEAARIIAEAKATTDEHG